MPCLVTASTPLVAAKASGEAHGRSPARLPGCAERSSAQSAALRQRRAASASGTADAVHHRPQPAGWRFACSIAGYARPAAPSPARRQTTARCRRTGAASPVRSRPTSASAGRPKPTWLEHGVRPRSGAGRRARRGRRRLPRPHARPAGAARAASTSRVAAKGDLHVDYPPHDRGCRHRARPGRDARRSAT